MNFTKPMIVRNMFWGAQLKELKYFSSQKKYKICKHDGWDVIGY